MKDAGTMVGCAVLAVVLVAVVVYLVPLLAKGLA